MSQKKDCTDVKSPQSKAGQLIGAAFETAVIQFIEQYIKNTHPEYRLLQPQEGKKIIRLRTHGGLARQMDNVIVHHDTQLPVALMESKWLKDARHHNDKGAWILQLREVSKEHPTVHGAAAILAGYWTSGVGLMLKNEGGVRMVWTATDKQVYTTLQPELDTYLGRATFPLIAEEMRKTYTQPYKFLEVLCHLQDSGRLLQLAQDWLRFETQIDNNPRLMGTDLIVAVLDELLDPLPETPRIAKFEVTLQVDTGNIIHQVFDDMESANQFILDFSMNPQKVRRHISPASPSDADNAED